MNALKGIHHVTAITSSAEKVATARKSLSRMMGHYRVRDKVMAPFTTWHFVWTIARN